MSNSTLDQNLQLSLNTLCKELNYILHLINGFVAEELEKYNQVVKVRKPWPLKQKKSCEDFSNLECTCTQSSIKDENKSSINDRLLQGIPKILNKTKALRTNPSKNSIRQFIETKKSIESILSKTESQKSDCDKDTKNSKKCKHSTSKNSIATTVLSSSKDTCLKSNESTHNPSCAMYKLAELEPKKSFSSLSEAVIIHGIPSSLNKIINLYQEYILNSENLDTSVTKGARDIFIQCLEKQNEKNWKTVLTSVEKLPKYMAAINSKEMTFSKIDLIPCFIYRNFEDLKKYQIHKTQAKRKGIWNTVLKIIIQSVLPEVTRIVLSEKEKLYIYKTIQMICNYSQSPVPKIPIIRLK